MCSTGGQKSIKEIGKDKEKIMNTDNIVIRLEKKEEYREVENLVRESF